MNKNTETIKGRQVGDIYGDVGDVMDCIIAAQSIALSAIHTIYAKDDAHHQQEINLMKGVVELLEHAAQLLDSAEGKKWFRFQQ